VLLSEGSAGSALRNLGITLDTAREAIADQHEARLASIGIDTTLPTPGPIVFHETDGYSWTQRANAVIGRASGKGKDGSTTAILRELLAEPSGSVSLLLERLGTTSAAVLEALDRSEPAGAAQPDPGNLPAPTARAKGEVTGSSSLFVPAPIGDVWSFLADPARVPAWEPSVGSVDPPAGEATVSAVWAARTPATQPNGKPIKTKERYRRTEIQLVAARRRDRVAWRFTSPDAPRIRPVTTRFALAPASGGTQVTVDTSWPLSPSGWRRPVGLLMRPARKVVVWLYLFQVGGAISRAFR
jgi:hypothetical protein